MANMFSEAKELDIPSYLGIEAVYVSLIHPTVNGGKTIIAHGMSIIPELGVLLSETEWDDAPNFLVEDGPLSVIVPFHNIAAIQQIPVKDVDPDEKETAE